MRVVMKPWNEIAKNHHFGEMIKDITQMAYELCEPYTPKDSGELIGQVTVSADDESGEIRYSAPYARKWYYTPANFQGAPKRGNFWFERMKAEGGKVQIAQSLAQKHGVKVR